MQLIYAGKTKRSTPQGIEFPHGFDVTSTPNHWSNEEKAIQHLEIIIIPYIEKTREELGLPEDQMALLIYDVFKGQKTEQYLQLLE